MSESCLFTSMIHCPTEPEIKNKYSERKKFLLFLCFGWLVNLLSTSLVAQTVKNLPAMQETRIQSLGLEDSLEKEMATHSNILAWRIPGMEEPGGLPSVGLHRVRHDWRDLAAASILAWRISWTEEPGRLQSMGLQELDTTQGLNHDHLMSEHASC